MELILRSILWYFLAVLVYAKRGEIRIADYKNYWEYQDIQKALENEDRKSWMFYRSYSEYTGGSPHTCVYSNVDEKTSEGSLYTFEQGYTFSKEGQNETKTLKLFATTFIKESLYTSERRTTDNAMKVSKTEGATNGRLYQLIYSDYKKCDILRVMDRMNGYACELYLHNNAVDDGVPENCKTVYGNACGKDDPSYTQQVYYPWCKKTIEGPKETTSAETTQEEQTEEVTTEATLPPGC
ncbi:uncharacterized protein LOC115310493 [Ixodes scapularis]|uniref:uncharacterized protein LOC115310493 n=1 Tax=Ixodes scapularis TaxID=6945 RepID=UPI001A9DA5E7|nr:uncharacterized protein LOC115310493 [Ixodes scapularis]